MKTYDKRSHDKSAGTAAGSLRSANRNERSLQTDSARGDLESNQTAPGAGHSTVTRLQEIERRANNNPRARQAGQLKEMINGSNQHASPKLLQRKLDPELTVNLHLQSLIKKYNEEYDSYLKKGEGWFANTEAERRAALKTLHEIELAVYGFFDSLNFADLDVAPANIDMKRLMNSVQDERRRLAVISLKEKDKNPPVANFDQLQLDEQQKITLIWNNLRKNSGIKIEGDQAFRETVLADFARLIENQFGRDLVHRIVIEKNALVITPTTLEKGKFVASPIDNETEGFTLLPEAPEDTENYVKVNPATLTENEKVSLFRRIRITSPDKKGVALKSASGYEFYKFGGGSRSQLPFPANARDAAENVSSRLLGSGNREVIAPTFVILAHELGHVLRSLLGISASKAGSEFIETAFGGKVTSDRPEEFFNINDIENAVRAENRISAREGHSNLYVQVTGLLFEKMDSWREYIKYFSTQKKSSSLNKKATVLEKSVIDIQEALQEILHKRSGALQPVYAKFREATQLAEELEHEFLIATIEFGTAHSDEYTEELVETTPTSVSGHVETVRGKSYEGGADDLYKAISDIAVDADLGDYVAELQQAFKKGQPFVSESALIAAFKNVLPPDRSSIAKEIGEYLIENSL